MSIKGQGHFLTLVKGHSDLNVKTFFLKDSWAIWNQSFYESLREKRMEMKIYTNELGHMTNMATMPIYGKNLKKSSSPEATDQ